MQPHQSLALNHSESGTEGSDEIVVRLTQENFASVVMKHRYTIVWAAHDVKRSSYPANLLIQLGLPPAHTARMGVVSLSKIEWSPSVQLFVRLGLERLNLKPDEKGQPPAGFYLLAKGLPIGFYPR